MKTNIPFYQTVPFWLALAFIVGFGVNQLLTSYGVNPLRSKAFMSAEYGGLPQDCSGFNYTVAYNCGFEFHNMNDFSGGSGGGSGGGGYQPATPPQAPTPASPRSTTRNPYPSCYYTGACD